MFLTSRAWKARKCTSGKWKGHLEELEREMSTHVPGLQERAELKNYHWCHNPNLRAQDASLPDPKFSISLLCFFLLKLTKVVSSNSEAGGNSEKGFPEGCRSSGAPCKGVAEASKVGEKGVAAEVPELHPTPCCYARHGFHWKETFHSLPQAWNSQGPGSPV